MRLSGLEWRVLVAVLVLAAGGVAVAATAREEIKPDRMSFALFPMRIGDWSGVQQVRLAERVVDVLGVEDYLTRAYVRPDGDAVSVYMGYWDSQRTGDTIHSPMNCLPGAGWEPVSSERISIPDPRRPDGPPIPVNRVVIQKGADRQLVYYWYQSQGRVVASEYWGKIYLVTDAVRHNRSDGAIVRVITPVEHDGSLDAADALVRRFIDDFMPLTDPFLPV